VSDDVDKRDRPRLLSARPGRDYVENAARAMRGEPEAVSEPDQQRITEDVRKRQELEAREQQARSVGQADERQVEVQRCALDALTALGRLRELLQGDLTDEARMIDHVARRLGPSLRKLLNRS
jgi:hypothetical protein